MILVNFACVQARNCLFWAEIIVLEVTLSLVVAMGRILVEDSSLLCVAVDTVEMGLPLASDRLHSGSLFAC